jgi:inorganic phosphate transporter, PiT family
VLGIAQLPAGIWLVTLWLVGASTFVLTQVATQLGIPVSTTHTITGAVMGAGAGQGLRLEVVGNIISSWILTVPATASIAWVMFAILHTAGLRA